jgi:hypothetical protein
MAEKKKKRKLSIVEGQIEKSFSFNCPKFFGVTTAVDKKSCEDKLRKRHGCKATCKVIVK